METDILNENKRRKARIFSDHDQLTGWGMEGVRRKVVIEGHTLPVQYLTEEVLSTDIYRQVMDAGGVNGFLRETGQDVGSRKAKAWVVKALIVDRCRHDPSFAFAVAFKIKDKTTGEIRPFILNYAQRILLAEFEEMRRAGKPIRIVLLKARQWGGSTLTQLYMAWVQLFVKEGWNSLIVAQTKDTAKRIKAMYSKVLRHFPTYIFDQGRLMFTPMERSAADSVISSERKKPLRNNVMTVSSFENYESTRGSDIAMAHYSEVAYWRTTPQKSAASLIRAVTSGIAEGVPLTMEVLESTANGKSGYFHDEYQEAKLGHSARRALFIPFFYIEHDMLQFADEEEERVFARQLIDHRHSEVTTEKTAECGRYLWSLWEKGATLEHIQWYVERRKSFHSHGQMASEAPSDDIECFTFSGKLMIDAERIAEVEATHVRQPIWRGDLRMVGDQRRMEPSETGPLKIWRYPEEGQFLDRYMVVVDVGGRSERADYSVITVFDRKNCIDNALPLFVRHDLDSERKGLEVVARWRGHLRYDLMAYRAVELAQMYDEALLVFESNTFDKKRGEASDFVEVGDHIAGILSTISQEYTNLYMRRSTNPEDLKKGVVRKVGFQTNSRTKQEMVDCFTVEFEEGRFHDPDEQFYKELAIYEQRPDGSYGNIPGANNHDDIVMTDMIGVLVDQGLPPVTPAYYGVRQHCQRGVMNESWF